MHEQRAHQKRPAPGHDANFWCLSLAPVGDLRGTQSAQFVGTGDDLKRTVSRLAVVQVKADCDHAFEHFDRGLHVENAVFYGPCAKARRIYSLSDSNCEVLMPRYLPICTGGFIEENAADNESIWTKNRFN